MIKDLRSYRTDGFPMRSQTVPKPDTGRRIHATVSDDVFAAVHWAHRRSRRGGSLADFLRDAIREKISRVATETAARGGTVPQTVAAALDAGRVGN